VTGDAPPAPYLDELWAALPTLRCCVVVGLPGTGKSLYLRELARRGAELGRAVHLLQWDIARRAWDRHPGVPGLYPELEGVTHPAIRAAANTWVRTAIERWDDTVPDSDLLLVEAPHVGGRFSALARRERDRVEVLLGDVRTAFAVVVPTQGVRGLLRQQRERDLGSASAGAPELGDAGVDVLDALTDSLRDVASALGLRAGTGSGYDPALCRDVMAVVLRHRRIVDVSPDRLLEVSGSVYELREGVRHVVPSDEDVAESLATVGSWSRHDLDSYTESWHAT
jgi:hypothetical protein